MSEPIALFDLDGTLCDYDEAMARVMDSIKHPSEPAYVRDYDDKSEPVHVYNRRKLIQSVPGYWKNLKPFPLGMELLQMAIELGFSIRILSKGPNNCPLAWSEKYEWCQNNLEPIIGPIGKAFRVTICQGKGETYGKVLVDDFEDYILDWLKHRPRGLVITPHHHYNADFKHQNVRHYTGKNREEIFLALREARDR